MYRARTLLGDVDVFRKEEEVATPSPRRNGVLGVRRSRRLCLDLRHSQPFILVDQGVRRYSTVSPNVPQHTRTSHPHHGDNSRVDSPTGQETRSSCSQRHIQSHNCNEQSTDPKTYIPFSLRTFHRLSRNHKHSAERWQSTHALGPQQQTPQKK